MSFFKNIAKNSTLCFALLHKNQLPSEPMLQRIFRNQCCIYFSSLVESADYGHSLKSIATISPSDESSDSFTINYLVNFCGLSMKKATWASKYVQFETPEKPNAVLAFLKEQGFSKPQIQKLVAGLPRILLSRPEKTLLPKIEFFRSLWISRTEVASNLSGNAHLMRVSLDKQLVPLFNYLKSVFLDDKRIASLVIWRTCVWYCDSKRNIIANIGLLRELGVLESHIMYLLAYFTPVLAQPTERLRELVSEVKEMGYDYSRSAFVLALHARFGKGSRSTWDKSYELYRSWGWSEDEIRRAFRSLPGCMIVSEKKINIIMDFVVNKMGWHSQILAQTPLLFCFSLERRIIPRGSVVRLLCLKGLLTKNISLGSVFTVKKSYFERRFVTPYEDQVPQLRDVYEGKVVLFDA